MPTAWRRRRRRSPASRKVYVANAPGARASARRSRRAGRGEADGQPRRLPRAGHDDRQEHRAARRRAARRHADQRHPLGRGRRTPSPARSTPATRSRRSSRRMQEGHHRPHDRVREGGGRRRLGFGRAGRCRRRSGQEQLRLGRSLEERAARAHQRQGHRLRAAARSARRSSSTRLLDPLADKLGAGGRREPRRGRRGLCAQRLSGRPDRQDRRSAKSISRSAFPARSSTSPE